MKALILGQDPDTIDDIITALQFRWPEVDILALSKGKEITKELEHNNIDIIILCSRLADVSVNTVIESIRRLSNVPVVAIGSMINDENALIKALEIGADEYVRPPYSQMELISRIKAVIRSKQNRYTHY